MKIPFIKSNHSPPVKAPANYGNKLKIAFFGVIVCSVIGVCVLYTLHFSNVLAINKATTSNQEKEAQFNTITVDTQIIESKITNLMAEVAALDTVVSTLQTQLTNIATGDTPTNKQTFESIEILSASMAKCAAELTNLEMTIQLLQDDLKISNTQYGLLQKDVQILQQNLKANATNIGTTSMSINGLDITFLTNNIDVGMTGSTTPNTAQFSIKIANNTSSVISKIDVTGTITSSNSLFTNLANGYPQVTDAAKSFEIAATDTGSGVIRFEAYNSTKIVTIPVGGSITIRPKVAILATKDNALPATTFRIAVNAITYDSGL